MFALLMLTAPALGQNPNVTVDDQPTAEQKLEQVLELRAANRHAEAADLIQELIVESRFKLVALGEGAYADAGQWSADILMRDGALRQAYTERYNAAAVRELEQARASEKPLAALLEVHRLYTATPSGLSAGLDAAGRMLEAGDAQSAKSLLAQMQRHPDRQTQLRRLQMLRGAAAAYTQDEALLQDVTQSLAELDPAMAEQLKQLSASIQPAMIASRPLQVDMGPKPISIRAPLWDRPLAQVDNAPRWLPDDKSIVPVVTPSFVLVNNGRQVMALDRASGQRAWVVPPDEDTSVQKVITAQRWYDDRSVARAEGKVAAVIGECHGITERRNPYVSPNDLVCIDEQTGKLRWRRTAADFRDDEPTMASDRHGRLNLQLTHFVGTPILSQGVVFAVLRRANSEADTQSSWLLAYDADSGSLLWYRHLALVSLSYTNADSMRVSPKLTLHGDTIYFSDCLGSVGAVDRHTGGYRWLRVLPVGSQNTNSIVANSRGVTSGPVMTDAGLLVPLTLSSDRLMLVDPEDGSVLRSFKEDPQLSNTQYILETNEGALAVGQTAVSYWDAEKAAVTWTFSFSPGETLRGRGDVSLRFAVFPTSERLIVLDLATGELLDQAEAVEGSVVVRDSEVLATSEGRLHTFTSWERVYQRLVDQVENRPEDPSAGLSLASIAMRQKDQNDSVLLGVGHALDAVSRQPIRRRPAVASHVFEQLRILIPQTEDAALRRALYQRLALVTQSAAQEAAYHLDAGLYFAKQGDTQVAVDHLHAVIAEPAFAAASYEMDGLAQPAGAIARQQIQALIDRFGRGVYARQDALAQTRIDELKASGSLNATALAVLAKRFPLSPAAGELLIEAAQAHEKEARLIAAASLYKQAVHRSVSTAQREQAAGRLLQFYLNTGRPHLAQDFLDHLTARHPGVNPIDGEQAMTVSQWNERIAATPSTQRQAGSLAADLDTPLLIPGRLITHTDQARQSAATDHIYLLHADSRITCHASSTPAEPRWRSAAPAGSGQVQLLLDHTEQVVFWAVDSGVVFALDTQTGGRLWQTAIPFETGEQVLGVNAAKTLVAVSETVLCMGDRDTAKVIAIDLASGGLLWQTTLEMTALTALAVDNWSVAAVGRAGHPQQLRSGKLSLLSLSDAQPLLPDGEVRIALTPFGVAIGRRSITVFGSSGVMAINPQTGSTLWTQRLADRILTGAHAMIGQRIAVETNAGEVHLLDASNEGKHLDTLAVRFGNDSVPTQLLTIDDDIWCLGTRGIYRLKQGDTAGWSSTFEAPAEGSRGLLIAQDHLAVIAKPIPARVENGLNLDLLEAAGGRLVQQVILGPLPEDARPQDATRLGNGLAIPVGQQTMVIPPANGG
jgi:outer membrane protein assembly factor BamB